MRKVQQGFTLIELIMVIVIIGILASVALPKFFDIQTDARKAKLSAIAGSIRSASAIAHSAALVKNFTGAAVAGVCPTGGAGLCMEGVTVDLVNGYPAATAGGIMNAAVNAAGDADLDVTSTAGTVKIVSAPTPATCSVAYVAAAAGGTPTITVTPGGC